MEKRTGPSAKQWGLITDILAVSAQAKHGQTSSKWTYNGNKSIAPSASGARSRTHSTLSRLDWQMAREIRRLYYKEGWSIRKIWLKYPVKSRNSIHKVLKNITWREEGQSVKTGHSWRRNGEWYKGKNSRVYLEREGIGYEHGEVSRGNPEHQCRKRG